MKISPAIKKETGHIALGVLIGDVVMLAVFLLLKRMDYTVILGALLGSAAAVLNFLFMGLGCQKAMNDPDRAQLIVRRSYSRRMLGMVIVMIVGFSAPYFHVVAVVLPFLMPSITIKVMQLLGLYNPKEKGGEK